MTLMMMPWNRHSIVKTIGHARVDWDKAKAQIG